MDSLAQNPALLASLLLLLTMLLLRQRQPKSKASRPQDRLDTVQAWPAQLVQVMSPAQRSAHEVLRQALPGHVVLFQVPLSQFMRVSTRQSYAEWYRRAGRLRATFLICDAQTTVVAAVDLHLDRDSEREQDRHERVGKVLQAMGLPVVEWHEGDIPNLAMVREAFAPLLAGLSDARVQSPPHAVNLAGMFSDDAEVFSGEPTDFGDLPTMPPPLDSRLA